MRRYLLAVALLAAPVVGGAQSFYPQTPAPFTGPVRTYTVHGCGDGPLSYAPNAPAVRVFCLDGTATVGVATAASGSRFFQTVLDLTGTRLNGFTGQFYDVEYSNYTFAGLLEHTDGHVGTVPEAYSPPADPTGRHTDGYGLFFPVGDDIPDDGISFGPTAVAQLGYLPQDAPPPPPGSIGNIYNHYFPFALAVTETPEPATLALTVSGLLLVAAGARRRRQA